MVERGSRVQISGSAAPLVPLSCQSAVQADRKKQEKQHLIHEFAYVVNLHGGILRLRKQPPLKTGNKAGSFLNESVFMVKMSAATWETWSHCLHLRSTRTIFIGVSFWIRQTSVTLSKRFTWKAVHVCGLTADAEDVSLHSLIKEVICASFALRLNYTSTVYTVKNTQTIV